MWRLARHILMTHDHTYVLFCLFLRVPLCTVEVHGEHSLVSELQHARVAGAPVGSQGSQQCWAVYL